MLPTLKGSNLPAIMLLPFMERIVSRLLGLRRLCPLTPGYYLRSLQRQEMAPHRYSLKIRLDAIPEPHYVPNASMRRSSKTSAASLAVIHSPLYIKSSRRRPKAAFSSGRGSNASSIKRQAICISTAAFANGSNIRTRNASSSKRITAERDTEHGIEKALHDQALIQDLRRETRTHGR